MNLSGHFESSRSRLVHDQRDEWAKEYWSNLIEYEKARAAGDPKTAKFRLVMAAIFAGLAGIAFFTPLN